MQSFFARYNHMTASSEWCILSRKDYDGESDKSIQQIKYPIIYESHLEELSRYEQLFLNTLKTGPTRDILSINQCSLFNVSRTPESR